MFVTVVWYQSLCSKCELSVTAATRTEENESHHEGVKSAQVVPLQFSGMMLSIHISCFLRVNFWK